MRNLTGVPQQVASSHLTSCLYCAVAENITPCVTLDKSLPFSEPPSLCRDNWGGGVLSN